MSLSNSNLLQLKMPILPLSFSLPPHVHLDQVIAREPDHFEGGILKEAAFSSLEASVRRAALESGSGGAPLSGAPTWVAGLKRGATVLRRRLITWSSTAL